MLFYAVKYHPPATASSVTRVIKPNRRAACIDRSTAKRPEHTRDNVSLWRIRAAPPPGGLARMRKLRLACQTAFSKSFTCDPQFVSCFGVSGLCPAVRLV